jgi:hypothetical protein
MVYPLLAALHSTEVRRTFLSTDDPGMARVGQYHGAEIINRPAGSGAIPLPLEEVIRHGYGVVTERLGQELEALVVLLANAPTVTSDLIDQGVHTLRADLSLDAVMSVSRRHESHPRYALRLTPEGRLRPFIDIFPGGSDDAYFPDALLSVLRPASFFHGIRQRVPSVWVVNSAIHRVAPLVHEGYGDVDYAWQIPAVEEWLRRRGFTEISTPYIPRPEAPPPAEPFRAIATPVSAVERRVLITTVPFGQANRRPLDLLEAGGVEYVINPIGRRLKEDELADMIGEFGILIAGTDPITARVMQAAPHLRLISRVGIGLDSVDLAAVRAGGIQVSYTPDAPSPAVAELTVGFMISLLRNIPGADHGLRNGVWHRFMGQRLAEQTVGVIGVGRVGKRVIQHLAGGFPTVKILANDLDPDWILVASTACSGRKKSAFTARPI